MKRKNISGGYLTPEEEKRLKKEKRRLDMQENYYSDEEGTGKKKKKKMGCCGCLFTMFLVFILFIGAGIGVGVYFGNKALKKNYGISIKDAFSVVGALYGADEDKIITNAPTDGDEAGFYAKINDRLYLKDGTITKNSFDGVLNSMLGQSSAPLTTTPVFLEGGNGASVEEVISRNNIDFTKLAKFTDEYDYDLNYTDDFVIAVTDKEIMALVKPVVEDKLGSVPMVGGKLEFKQISFYRTILDQPALSAVVELDLDDLVYEVLGDSGLPKIVRKVVKGVLPGEIFVTVSVTLDGEIAGDIVINNMNAKQQNTVHQLISAITGRESRVIISDFIADNTESLINKADDMMRFSENMSHGAINFDLFSLLAGTAFSGSEVSGTDMAVVYTTMLKAETENMLASHTADMFEHQYREEGKDELTYSETPIEGATLVDYKQEFMDEFSSKYLVATEFYRDVAGKVYLPRELDGTIKQNDEYIQTLFVSTDGKNTVYSTQPELTPTKKIEFVSLEFEDIASLVGIGSSQKTENLNLQALFDASLLTKKIGGADTENKEEYYINQTDETLKLNLSEKMLASLVDAQVKNLMGEDSALTSSLDLRFLKLVKGSPEEITLIGENGTPLIPVQKITVERKFMIMGFTLEAKKMFNGVELITGLLEDEIGLIVSIEITPEIEEKYLTTPEITYADLSKNRTNKVLDILIKMGMDFLTPNKVQELLGKPVRDAIVKMRNTLGGIDLLTGALKVPDVFTLLTEQMFPENPSKVLDDQPIVFEPGEIHRILRRLYDLPDTITIGNKVYLATKNSGGELTLLGALGEGKNNDDSRVDKLNSWIAGSSGVPQAPTLDADLGQVVGYYYQDNKMIIAYEYSLAKYLGNEASESGLLSMDKIYATFEVDFDTVTGKATATKMKLDKMTDEERYSVEKMMVYLNESNAGKFEAVETSVGVFAETVRLLEEGNLFDLIG